MTDMAVTPDATRVLVRGRDGVHVFDPESGRALHSPLSSVSAHDYRGPFDPRYATPRDFAISTDGSRAIVIDNNGLAWVWDLIAAKQTEAPWSVNRRWRPRRMILNVAAAPTSDHVVTISSENAPMLRVWSLSEGRTVAGPTRIVEDGHHEIVVTPDGKRAVESIGSFLRVREIATGEVTAGPWMNGTAPDQWYFPWPQVNSLTVAPDGTRAMTAGPGGMWMWSLGVGDAGGLDDDPWWLRPQVDMAALAPDWSLLATKGPEGLLVEDVAARRRVGGPWTGHEGVCALTIGPRPGGGHRLIVDHSTMHPSSPPPRVSSWDLP